jgi:hypothetical protein
MDDGQRIGEAALTHQASAGAALCDRVRLAGEDRVFAAVSAFVITAKKS